MKKSEHVSGGINKTVASESRKINYSTLLGVCETASGSGLLFPVLGFPAEERNDIHTSASPMACPQDNFGAATFVRAEFGLRKKRGKSHLESSAN